MEKTTIAQIDENLSYAMDKMSKIRDRLKLNLTMDLEKDLNYIDGKIHSSLNLASEFDVSLNSLLLKTALKYVGTKETGNNSNPFGKFYNLDGVSWCALFISFLLDQNKSTMFHKDGKEYMAYVPTIQNTFNVRKDDPKVGDIVLFSFDGTNEAGHIGIVKDVSKWKQTNSIESVEGNTSPRFGSQDNGDGVYIKERSQSVIIGFITPTMK